MYKIMFVALVFLTAFALQAKGINFSGSLYSDLSLLHYHVPGKDSAKFSGMSVLELKAENSDKKYFKFKADIDFYLLYGEQAKLSSALISSVISNIPGLSSAPVKINLRELYFTLYPSFADIAIGKQIINFGKGMVLSPIDIFSPVNISDINFKRSGSDVINIKVPLGTLSGIDIITQIPVGDQEHSSALKVFTNFHNFDIDLTGIYRHKANEAIFGASFKGDLFAGIYGEFTEHFSNKFKSHYAECMIGTDYSLLSNNLVFNLEYSFNQNPINPDSIIIGSFNSIDKTLFRKHYLFFNTQYSVNELLSLSGNLIYNIQDTGLAGTVMARYNMLQNVYHTGYIRGYHNNLNGFHVPQPDIEYALRVDVAF